MKAPALRIVKTQNPPADGALLVRMAAGDLGALGELYDRYAAMLLRFVRKHSPTEDAEDIVQITFLRALDVAGRFDSTASARPWLFGIALRVQQERRRSVRRWAAALAEMAQLPRALATAPSGAVRDVDRALARLSEAKRSVVLLAEVEGFSCPEIASILGVPVGTVWTRLHHARRELRQSFEEKS